MSHFSHNFNNYEDDPLNFEKYGDNEFSFFSPNSESTAFDGNVVSSPENQYFVPTDQYSNQNYYQGTPQEQVPYYAGQANNYDEIFLKNEDNEKSMQRNKRITKRKIAKERTKTKQDMTAFLEGVDSKFLPEGFDDPNLDERTKKKMIQMVRNRISAQNSRDKKKVLLQNLEEINSKLVSEKDALFAEVQKLRETNTMLYEENQQLKQGNMCSVCRRAHSGESSTTQESLQVTSEEESGGFSGLNSPVLSRFVSNGGRSFMTFFALAAFVSCVVLVNLPQDQQFVMHQGMQNNMMNTQRFLEEAGDVCNNPDELPEIKIQPKQLDYLQSLVIRNIHPLKKHFQNNSESTFKAHMKQKNLLFNDGTLIQNDPQFQNALANPIYHHQTPTFLRRKVPTYTETLPVISQQAIEETSNMSTLYCPSGLEFFGESGNEGSSGQGLRKSLNIEKANYLQLFVPRNTISRYEVNGNVTDLDDTVMDTDQILEVWCKVFYVRELSLSEVQVN